ncbi:hypothetical protein [Kitasatospora camelliae]|uniref:Uncharacterized protein n=1 Tax=Kitasatospora camelliae TaxID=3156397 RepID=A0AAU8JXD2_9ACTN
MPRDDSSVQRSVQLRLGRLPGYVRQPDLSRRSGEEGRTYKKGWEVRFTARTEAEIAEIRELVVAAGFAPARPFFKGQQLIQPVYGIAAVQAYLAAREAAESVSRSRRGGRTATEPGLVTEPARIPGQSRREQSGRGAADSAGTAAAAAAAGAAAAAAARRARAAAASPEGAEINPAGRTS